MDIVRKTYLLAVFMLFFFVTEDVFSQKTLVYGTVYEKGTDDPIPYANISFKHSSVGAITDYKGYFHIVTSNATDTLLASYLGYEMEAVSVDKFREQEVNFYLEPAHMTIEEVVVTPGENPAFEILRNIYAHKKDNNPERYQTYHYKTYNKLRLDINNIDEDFTRRKILNQFKFVFENIDSSEIFGKTYLPVLITESVSDFYYQKRPKVEREVIEAYQMSGITNTTFAQFSGKMYQQLNIYQDFMTFIEPGFVSPIADFGKMTYNYHLEDSTTIDGHWCYKITFAPKRKRERTFYGYFWVADTTWGIKKMQLRVASDVNINFINDMMAVTEYQLVDDSLWFIKNEEILLDFNLGEDTYGFFGRRNASYSDIVVDKPIPGEILKLNTDTHVLEDEALAHDNSYWEENRMLELKEDEANIYEMVDSVKNVPVFKTVYSIADMLFAYYYEVGKFEIGPYYTFYSTNPIEGSRFKFGARTSENFNSTFRLGGYAAYGTLDKDFKYGGTFEYLLNKNPRQMLTLMLDHDVRLLGKSDNALLDDNILTTLLQRNPNYKLTPLDQYKVMFEREWFQGFYNTISFKHLTVYPTKYVPFDHIEGLDTIHLSNITTSEVTLHTHYAYKEKYLDGKFDRVSVGTKSPVFDLYLTYGMKGVLGSQYEYFKIGAQLMDNLELNPFGYTHYVVSAGKIFGEVPYPLLELHKGNETYGGDRTAFNMMNYYEFASDIYLSVMAEHHFQGFFLKRIPLLNKMELREVVGAKFLWGDVQQDHQSIMEFYDIQSVKVPYSEASIGIENIFKLFRIDAVWRLAYLDNPDIEKFSIRVYTYLMF